MSIADVEDRVGGLGDPVIQIIKCHTWILLWAEKSAGPQSGKIFRRIPKKTPET